jgi:hypothetical protein
MAFAFEWKPPAGVRARVMIQIERKAAVRPADLIHGRLAPFDGAVCSYGAEALPEIRHAVADYRRVGAGAHRCGARQTEQRANLAEVVAGLDDSEHFQAAWSLTDHLELTFRDHVDQIS